MKMAFTDDSSLPNSKLVELFERTHEDALLKNEENVKFLTKNRNEYLALQSHLETLPNKLSHDVMVPIGSRALMRGKIVHTNEILVCLGDGWFVKQSAKLAAEICSRRIQSCSEVLTKLEQERNLLTSRKQLPIDQEAFGGNDIVEPYDEKLEAEWKIRHKQKERQYRQQLAKQRTEKTVIQNDDDKFWEKLERLELQEELEEELQRLHEKRAKAANVALLQSPLESIEGQSVEGVQKPLKVEDEKPRRRVSFANIHTESSDGESDSSTEPLSIEFSHTSIEKSPEQLNPLVQGQSIRSPADIYNMFPKSGIKSILKQNSNTTNQSLASFDQSSNELVEQNFRPKHKVKANIPQAFGDVLEHQIEKDQKPSEPVVIETKRPLSRFQAARQSSKK